MRTIRQQHRKLRYLFSAAFLSMPALSALILLLSWNAQSNDVGVGLFIIAVGPLLVLHELGLLFIQPATISICLAVFVYIAPAVICLLLYGRSGRRSSRWQRLQNVKGKPLF